MTTRAAMRKDISVLIASSAQDGKKFKDNHPHVPEDAVIITPRSSWVKSLFGCRAALVFHTELSALDTSPEAKRLRKAVDFSHKIKSASQCPVA